MTKQTNLLGLYYYSLVINKFFKHTMECTEIRANEPSVYFFKITLQYQLCKDTDAILSLKQTVGVDFHTLFHMENRMFHRLWLQLSSVKKNF